MKKIFSLILIFTLISCSKDSEPENISCVFEGDLTLKTQEEINTFVSKKYCTINGNLVIGNSSKVTDINSLIGLKTLSSITGDLNIINNPNLSSLGGLQNIKKLERVEIYFNSSLKNLEGLGSLTSIQNIQVLLNGSLISLAGLENLSTIQTSIIIEENPSLTSINSLSKIASLGGNLIIKINNSLENLTGLESLTTLNNLVIFGNNNLVTISGIRNISRLNRLSIGVNNSLTSLPAFSNITIGTNTESGIEIEWNNSLASLNGLEDIKYFKGDVIISSNTSLSDLCALKNILVNGITNNISIGGNLLNPSFNDIKNGTSCRL